MQWSAFEQALGCLLATYTLAYCAPNLNVPIKQNTFTITITMLSTTILGITAFSIKSYHKDYIFIVMLNVFMLSVIVLSFNMLSAISSC